MVRVIVFLTLLLFMGTAATSAAVKPLDICSAFLGSEDLDGLMNVFFKELGEPPIERGGELNKHFDEVWNSPGFRQFLAAEHSNEMRFTQAEKIVLMSQYIDKEMAGYRNQTYIDQLQDYERFDRLHKHGVNTAPFRNSWEALEFISKTNVQRIQGTLAPCPSCQIPTQDEEVVKGLELFYVHNSIKIKSPPGYPILAPKELKKIGLDTFGKSSTLFHEFIGSNAHIYGFMLFRRHGQKAIHTSEEYGGSGFSLKDSYMRSHAMVSAWIMYPRDLKGVAEKLNPAYDTFLKNYEQKLERSWIPAPALSADEIRDLVPKLKPVLGLLHRLDFTPADYESLVRELALHRLSGIYQSDRPKYDQIMAQLRSSNVDEVSKPLEEILGFYLNQQSAFEATVPVSIPETEIDTFIGHPRQI